MHLNKSILIGVVTELLHDVGKDNLPILRLLLNVTHRRSNGEERVNLIQVSAFGTMAEKMTASVRLNQEIAVEGRLETWQNPQRGYEAHVVATHFNVQPD